MEIYEVLFAELIVNVEIGDVIRFTHDGEVDQVTVEDIDAISDEFTYVWGYSHVTGDMESYEISNNLRVEVLGG